MSSNKPICVAILGTGKIAHTHARALCEIETAQLVTVCGRSEEKTRAFAETYGARAHTSPEAMLANPDIDAVMVCTPHPLHAAHSILAAQSRRHVLVEKPMALSVADCDQMIGTARDCGVKLGVISQRRLYEPTLRVKRALDEGKLGSPILGMCVVLGWRGPEYYAMDPWRGTLSGEGGGVLVTQASHQLDLFQWFMGQVEEVFAYTGNLNHPYIEVEDTAIAVVRFSGGALGVIVASNSQNPGLYARIHIHGKNGATIGVQTDGGSTFISGVTTEVEAPVNDVWTIPGEHEMLARWQAQDRMQAERANAMEYYHQLQIRDFLEAIRLGREPMVPGEQGRKSVELFCAIYESQQTGKPVTMGNRCSGL